MTAMLVLTTTCAGWVAAEAADKCMAAKLKAVGRLESGLLKCHAKVASSNDATGLSACRDKATGKFTAAFAKAGVCAGVEASCDTNSSDCESAVTEAMADTLPSKCEAAKLKAAGRLTKSQLMCHAKAAKSGGAVEADCLTDASGKFSAAILKAGACPDGGSPLTLVEDACVGTAVAVGVGDLVTDVCPDKDECTLDADDCDVDATCTNTVGSYTCTCNTGFTGDGVTCADIDECALDTDNCDVNATCTNTVGSFACACNAGFTGDGVTCADIDECALDTDNCDVDATCANTVGSFTCTCNAGFTGDGVTCNDIDECSLGTDNCDVNATCANTPGSFTCTCNEGFAGDGVTCVPACGNDCWGAFGCLTGAGRCVKFTCRSGNAGPTFCDACLGWTEVTYDQWMNQGYCGDVIQKFRETEGTTTYCSGAPTCCDGSANCGGGDNAWHFSDGVNTHFVGPCLGCAGNSNCSYWDAIDNSAYTRITACERMF